MMKRTRIGIHVALFVVMGVLICPNTLFGQTNPFLSSVPGYPNWSCMDAADVNDDGMFNGLTDGLFVLAFQFQGGPPPPPPGPFLPCGSDPTPDEGGVDLGCETQPARC